MDPKLQYIASQRSLDDAFDKTGVLMSRVKHLEDTHWNLPGKKKRGHLAQYLPSNWEGFNEAGGAELAPEDADAFLLVNGIEAHAAAQFKAMPPKIQYLCQQTTMEDARDKTAVLIGRMKKYGHGVSQRQGSDDPNEVALQLRCAQLSPKQAEIFLSSHNIEGKAQIQFLSMHPKLQYLVTRKPLDDAKDKTAVVISRMNQLSKIQVGDWVCNRCEDLQFSRKTVCGNCGAPRVISPGEGGRGF